MLDPQHGPLPTLPTGVHCLAYRGSIAHGMFVPSGRSDSIDDVDLMGFVIPGQEHYFGLTEWSPAGTKQITEGHWDIVLYDLHKAVRLLLVGNPNIMAMLWTQPKHWIFKDEVMDTLIQNRHLFAGKHVYSAFSGYADAQMKKMEQSDPIELREYLAVTAALKCRGAHPNHIGEFFPIPDTSDGVYKDALGWSVEKLRARFAYYTKKGSNLGYMGDKRKQLVLEHGYDCKNAAHLIRLLRMGLEYLQTGEMQVERPDAATLMSIKRGQWSLTDVKAMAEDLFAQGKALKETSTLPDGPDEAAIEKLLCQIMRKEATKWSAW